MLKNHPMYNATFFNDILEAQILVILFGNVRRKIFKIYHLQCLGFLFIFLSLFFHFFYIIGTYNHLWTLQREIVSNMLTMEFYIQFDGSKMETNYQSTVGLEFGSKIETKPPWGLRISTLEWSKANYIGIIWFCFMS